MDRKTKLLLGTIIILALFSISALFYRSLVIQDFILEDTTGESGEEEVTE